MTLQVIGAGLGRTGTTSLKLALERLIGGRCHHMEDVIRNKKQIKLWHEASLGKKTDWEVIFSGYRAAVDAPSAHFWRDLMHVYPNALVILSVRDSESWWNSAAKTIFTKRDDPRVFPEWVAMIKALPSTFSDARNRDLTIKEYEQHNAEVQAVVPAERLLVWRVEDGWEPLCKALNVPVPKEPFPQANLRGSWTIRRIFGRRLADFYSRLTA